MTNNHEEVAKFRSAYCRIDESDLTDTELQTLYDVARVAHNVTKQELRKRGLPCVPNDR